MGLKKKEKEKWVQIFIKKKKNLKKDLLFGKRQVIENLTSFA